MLRWLCAPMSLALLIGCQRAADAPSALQESAEARAYKENARKFLEECQVGVRLFQMGASLDDTQKQLSTVTQALARIGTEPPAFDGAGDLRPLCQSAWDNLNTAQEYSGLRVKWGTLGTKPPASIREGLDAACLRTVRRLELAAAIVEGRYDEHAKEEAKYALSEK